MRPLMALLPLLWLLALVGCAARAPLRDMPPAVFWTAEGNRAAAEGQRSAALEAFKKALREDDTHLAAHRGYIKVMAELGRLKEVRGRYRARIAQRRSDHIAHYALGLAWFSHTEGAPDVGRAAQHLSTALSLAPRRADYHYRLGLVYLEDERLPAAVERLEAATELAPKQAGYHVPLALAQHRLGDNAAALATLARVLELEPTQAQLTSAQRLSQRITNGFRKLPAAIEDELQQGLDWLEARNLPERARALFEEMAQAHPQLAVAHTLLGLAHSRLGAIAKAVDSLQRAAKIDPRDPMNHLALAELYEERGDAAKADIHYREAVTRDPYNLRARRGLADEKSVERDAAASLPHLRALTLLAPDDLENRLRYAGALKRGGQSEPAERQLFAIVRRRPQHRGARIELAVVELQRCLDAESPARRKRHAAATRAHLEVVLAQDPADPAATQLLAKLEEATARE